MILPIVTHPNDILRKKSVKIDREFIARSDTQKLIDDMIETMKKADGVGLAAPQIGQNIRLVVIEDPTSEAEQKSLVLINPVWEKMAKEQNSDSEGCLSFPGIFGKVNRYSQIKLTALDRHGNEFSLVGDRILSRIVQHEVDHLDGILFIDKATEIEESL